MSKVVDLSQPISDEDREYLKQRSRHYDIEENDRQFGKGKFSEDHVEEYKGTNTVAAPPIEPGSAADNPPRFVGNRPHGVDRAVWGGSTGLSEQEGYAATAGEPHADGSDQRSTEAPEDITDPDEAAYKEPGSDDAGDEEPEPTAVEDLTVPELKAELKARGLHVSGDKEELVARLNSALEEEEKQES